MTTSRPCRSLLVAFLCVFPLFRTKAQLPSPFSVVPKPGHSANACQVNNSSDPSSTAGAGNSSCAPAPAVKKLPIRIVPYHDPKQPSASAIPALSSSAPAGAHLTYFGGPVISNVEVVVVYWSDKVSSTVTGSGGIVDFYQTVVDSTYLDLLYEYSTKGVTYNNGSSNQEIGHGTAVVTRTINPSQTSGTIDDAAIQTELQNQIAAGNLPAPSLDANGDSNTLYAVYFPPGMTITQGGSNSCQSGGFCAYHGSSYTKANDNTSPVFQYSVNPDFSPGSGCDIGCGTGSQFQNITSVSSHELAESITDAQVGFAGAGNGPPLAWYDNANGEIADICVTGTADEQATVTAQGKSVTVQKLWLNTQGACVSGPNASLSLTAMSTSVPTGTPLSLTVTVNSTATVNNSSVLPFYTGTIHFTSTDSTAQLPADYTFTTTDAGSHTFSLTFNTTGTWTVTATDNDVSSISGKTANVTVTQGQQTPVITWPTPSPITYGTPLGSAQLDATANVGGTFTYKPVAGTVLPAGLQELDVAFSPNDTTNYKNATASVFLQVNKAIPTITWATPAPITYGTALSATQLNATSSAQGNFSYNPSIGSVLPAGASTLKATFAPTDTTDYTSASATVTLQVNQVKTSLMLTATPSAVTAGQSVTLQASLNVPAPGTLPSNGETVTFYLGTAVLGTAPLMNGQAGLSTTTLPVGTDSVVASYGGDNNFTASTSNIITVAVMLPPDFTIKPLPPSETVPPSRLADFILQLQSVNGFNANVTLSCSGGPSGSYCTDFPMTEDVSGTAYAASAVWFPKGTKAGTYTVTFKAVSGTLTHTTTAAFTVK